MGLNNGGNLLIFWIMTWLQLTCAGTVVINLVKQE